MKHVKTACNWILASILMAMVGMTFINAMLRYTLHTNITVFEELCRFAFIWVTYIGAIITYIEGRHVGVDSVINHLHGISRLIVRQIGKILILIISVAIGWGGWLYFAITYNLPAPSSGLPMGCVNITGMILAIFMFFITLRDMVQVHKDYLNEKHANQEVAN